MLQRDHKGQLAAVAVLLTLAGSSLWVAIVMGPVMVASGLAGTRDQLRRAEKELGSGDEDRAAAATFDASALAKRARKGLALGRPSFDLARAIPKLRGAVDQLPRLVAAAHHSGRAAVGGFELTHGALKGPESLLSKDPQGNARVRLAGIPRLRRLVSGVSNEIEAAARELHGIDITELPRRLRRGVKQGIREAAQTQRLLQDAHAGLGILPGVLGRDGPRLYLLGMQNSAELRGSGGAILQFAFLSLDGGRAELIAPQTVYKIDIERRRIAIDLPPDAWYQRGIPDSRRFGNANWSPDWPLSANLTLAYAAAAKNRFNINFPDQVDGVLAVDPITMQELIPATGPQRIRAGHRLTHNTIVSFVLHKAYTRYPIPAARRAVLRQVVDRFYKALLTPRRPTGLLTGMGRSLGEKHVQIWLSHPREQAFIERMNWDGGIDKATGADFLYVVQQNVGGNKLDYFATQTNEVVVRPAGSDALVTTNVRIANQVFLPQPRWSLGDSGPLHRPMVNVYVPGTARLQTWSVEGKRLDTPEPARWLGRPAEHRERGKKVWTATLEIEPNQEGAVRFGYRVPGVVKKVGDRSIYRLVAQRQPKVRAERLVVRFELPPGATHVRAPGWRRQGATLVWDRPLKNDSVLEVSWRS